MQGRDERPKRRIDYRLAGALVLVLAAGGFAASRIGSLREGVLGQARGAEERRDPALPAPEFAGISTWINSPPLTIRELRGSVVLVDFWTYSCVNCIRTLPALRALYARYHPVGLEIVGVHSPEFEFEKTTSNVRGAVQRHRIAWPVAVDNQMRTWRAYRNQYWPHVYLIDRAGVIRFDHVGEGGEDLIESKIRGLLAAGGAALPAAVNAGEHTVSAGTTPEIYLGYGRGEYQRFLASPEGYLHDLPRAYTAPRAAAAGFSGTFLLSGTWTARSEFVEAGERAVVVLPFAAADVYVVAGPGGARGAALDVLLDGAPLPPRLAGTGAGDGAAAIGRFDLYHLVRLGRLERHTLTLRAPPGVRLYTFTFG